MTALDLGAPPPHRRPSLTPMIDVVFLLLVFFILAARLGAEAALPVSSAGRAADAGPPRLVEIGADSLRLNGAPLADADLPDALAPLLAGPDDIVVLRPEAGVTVARLVAVAEALAAAGFDALAVVP